MAFITETRKFSGTLIMLAHAANYRFRHRRTHTL